MSLSCNNIILAADLFIIFSASIASGETIYVSGEITG